MRRLLFTAAGTLAVLTMVLPAHAAGGGGGCAHDGDIATEARGVRVTMPGVCFTPTVLWLTPGQTVTWVNDGGMEHTVTSPAFTLQAELPPGTRYTFRFDNVGVFPYMCQYHPGMAGAVVVGTPKAPAAKIPAPKPNDGIPGEVGTTGIDPIAAAGDAVASKTATAGSDGGTVAGVAALSGAALGAIGFTLGRRRRTL